MGNTLSSPEDWVLRCLRTDLYFTFYLTTFEVMQMFRMNLVNMGELVITQDDVGDIDSDFSS